MANYRTTKTTRGSKFQYCRITFQIELWFKYTHLCTPLLWSAKVPNQIKLNRASNYKQNISAFITIIRWWSQLPEAVDWVKVLRPTRHKVCHFGNVLPSQCLGVVLRRLNLTQQKQTTQEQHSLSYIRKTHKMLNLILKPTLNLELLTCVSLCTTVVHNEAQKSADNFRSYPPDNHHRLDDACWRSERPEAVKSPLRSNRDFDLPITDTRTHGYSWCRPPSDWWDNRTRVLVSWQLHRPDQWRIAFKAVKITISRRITQTASSKFPTAIPFFRLTAYTEPH